jgi:hypothetical protein
MIVRDIPGTERRDELEVLARTGANDLEKLAWQTDPGYG